MSDNIKFLTGTPQNLEKKSVVRGQVYFTVDSNKKGQIVFDAPISASQTERITMSENVKYADRAGGVDQTAITASDYTNWRTLIFGASNSETEGFTPTTQHGGPLYATNVLSVQPSTGTIRAKNFKTISGNFTAANTGFGLYLTDSASNKYAGIYDNGTNLWIGATSSDGMHHKGSLFLSTGYTGTIGQSGVAASTGAYLSFPTFDASFRINGHTSRIIVNGTAGNATTPVFINSNGQPTATTYSLNATINAGTANHLAFYSNARSIAATNLSYQRLTNQTVNTANNVEKNILRIWGPTYGNFAESLTSGKAGVMSWNDGGPQIQFSELETGGQQGALIYTDNNSAGTGVSWHFVSTEEDWSVNSKRFVAKTSVTIGQDIQNNDYKLYVNGSSYFNENITLNTDYTISRAGKSISWNQANKYALIRMTSQAGWSPIMSLKTNTGWWTMGHYNSNGFNDHLIFGFLADVDVDGATNAKNHLDYKVRLLPTVYATNTATETDRAFVTAPYNSSKAVVGSASLPVYINDSGVATTITSYEGNAATATTASKLGTTDVGSGTKGIYLKAGVATAMTYNLSATVNAGTANRLSYYSGANAISQAASLYTTGANLGINTTTTTVNSTSYTLYVNGNSYLNGTVNLNGKIYLKASDVYGDTLPTNAVAGQIFFKKGASGGGAAESASKVTINDDTTSKLYVLGATGTGALPIYRESSVYMQNNVLYGAGWNDYAECRETYQYIEPGRCVCENGDGTLSLSYKRLQSAPNIVSDTFGFIIGKTEKANTPLAVSGRVLVYTYEDRNSFKAGDVVCSGPEGTVSKMTREEIQMYPDKIVGIVSEIPHYSNWGEGNVKVRERIWIKVK